MRASIHNYFQVGTIRWMSFPRLDALEAATKIARDDYFDAIEITKCATDEEREALKHILETSHLKVCYGAQPRLLGPKLNPTETPRKKSIRQMVRVMLILIRCKPRKRRSR